MDIKQYLQNGTELFRYAPKGSEYAGVEVFALIGVHTEIDGCSQLAKFIWQASLDEYYNYQSDPLLAIKRMTRAGMKRVTSFVAQGSDGGKQMSSRKPIDIDLLVFIKKGLQMYFTVLGGQGLYIWREEEVLHISKYLKKHNINYGSVVLQESDVILLSSSDCKLPIKSLYSAKALEKLEENVRDTVGLVAFCLREMKQEEVKTVPGKSIRSEGLLKIKTSKSGQSKESDVEQSVKESDVVSQDKNVSGVIDREVQDEGVSKVIDVKIQDKPTVMDVSAISGMNMGIEKSPDSLVKKRKPVGFVILKKLYNKLPQGVHEFFDSEFMCKLKDLAKQIMTVLSSIYVWISKKLSVVFQVLGSAVGKLGVWFELGLQSKYGRKTWFKRWSAKVTQFRMGRTSSMQGVKIYGANKLGGQTVGKRTKLFVVLVALVCLLLGYRWIQQKRLEIGIHGQVIEKLDQVTELVTDAGKLAETDEEGARVKSSQAWNLLYSAEELATLDVDGASIKDLRGQLNDLDANINDVIVLSEDLGNIEVFLDGKLSFGDSSNLSDVALRRDQYMNEQLFVTDEGEGAVFRVSLYNESVVRIDDDNAVLTSPQYLSVGVSGIYVYENSGGMYKSSFNDRGKNGSWKPLVALGADSVGGRGISDLAVFTKNDNVYLLSKNDGVMLKSYGEGGGYGLPVTYLEDTDGGEILARSTDLLGDYFYVYILSKDSIGIHRYVSEQGVSLREDTVQILGVYPEIDDLQCGFTGASMNDDFYVFDNGNSEKRVIRFEKPNPDESRHPGKFVMINQYVYRGQKKGVFDNVQDLVVDAAQKYMYVIDGVKVWRITL